MEDKEHGLVGRGALLCLDVFLVLVQQFRVKANITWLVDTMDITEAGSDGEVWRDLLQSGVDHVNVLGLSVQGVVVNVLVVDTIFFTTSDADFLGSN